MMPLRLRHVALLLHYSDSVCGERKKVVMVMAKIENGAICCRPLISNQAKMLRSMVTSKHSPAPTATEDNNR